VATRNTDKEATEEEESEESEFDEKESEEDDDIDENLRDVRWRVLLARDDIMTSSTSTARR